LPRQIPAISGWRETIYEVACAISFLLGGVAAVLIMGLLLLFIEKPLIRTKNNQYLKQIANSLLSLTEFKKA
jgi:hypothetical protein